MKTISILGSTGCIGRKALDIASSNNFEILAITGHKNFKLILEQAKLYKPKCICITNEKSYNIVKSELSSYPTQIFPGEELENIAAIDVDCCVMAISGNAGIIPTFSSLGYAKRLAIATKEAIISGGKCLMKLAKEKNTQI
ncbi:MAG: hypothetical protein LBU35_03275, partial [Holosporales bacterium]|nr:hypothetical protein [Holosporales bacterium]